MLTRKAVLRGGAFGAVMYVFTQLPTITMQSVPENYRPCLMFLVYAKLCDSNLMGAREVFWFSSLYAWNAPFGLVFLMQQM